MLTTKRLQGVPYVMLMTALLWLSVPSFQTEAAELEVRMLEHGNTSFPWFSGSTGTIAEDINDMLFLEVFQQPAPRGNPPSIEGYELPDSDWNTFQDAHILRNDGRILSIELVYSVCGNRCRDASDYIHFDLLSGHKFSIDDLLTQDGRAALQQASREAFVQQIHKHIGLIESGEAVMYDEDSKQEAIRMYRQCHQGHERAISEGSEWKLPIRMNQAGLEIIHEHCSPGVVRALDDLGEYVHRVGAKDLKAALTPYGQILLGYKRADVIPPSFGRVLRGTIGSAPIRVYLPDLPEDGSVAGIYYYERWRKPLWLRGQMEDGRLLLSEYHELHVYGEPEPEKKAALVLEEIDGTWAGSWTGAEGRFFSVKLQ